MRSSPRSLPGPDDITRETLPNGITVLARANFSSPSVVISGYVEGGSICDPDEKLGLADFVACALMRGTRRRDFHAIYDALESAGASLGFSASMHTVGFSGRALAEDLPLLLTLLSESLRMPTFPADQIRRLRGQLLASLAIRDQDTGDRAGMAFDALVYAGHPYSRPQDGHPRTVRAITRADLAAFHRRHFGPRGMVLAVVGAVEPQRAVDLVARALGDWSNPMQAVPPSLPPVRPLRALRRRHVRLAGKVQSDLLIGCLGPRRTDPDFLPASLGNSVLGQFGSFGRIGTVVREQAGLAYYALSSLSAGIGPGVWQVSAGVNPAHLERAIALILRELRRFVQSGVKRQELADSQANFIGRLPLSLESNAGVAGALLNIERYRLGMDYYRRYAALVRAVTPEQVLETARKYIDPERLAIVSAGP